MCDVLSPHWNAITPTENIFGTRHFFLKKKTQMTMDEHVNWQKSLYS